MKSIEPVAIEMDIIINVIITVMATLSGRKRPKKAISTLLAILTKTTNMLHHAGKLEAKI